MYLCSYRVSEAAPTQLYVRPLQKLCRKNKTMLRSILTERIPLKIYGIARLSEKSLDGVMLQYLDSLRRDLKADQVNSEARLERAQAALKQELMVAHASLKQDLMVAHASLKEDHMQSESRLKQEIKMWSEISVFRMVASFVVMIPLALAGFEWIGGEVVPPYRQNRNK